MKAITMSREQLMSDIGALMERFQVVGPVLSGDRLDYLPLAEPDQLVLSDDLPYKSPKEVVFPRVERILRFTKSAAEEAQTIRPILLIGAKPCDLEALRDLDDIFTGEQGRFTDPFYQNRRKALVKVGMACKEEKRGCFCALRGIDRTFSSRCDAFLTEEENGFTLRVLTGAAEGLFSGAETETAEPAPPPPEQLRITADENALFGAMPWDAYAEGCIGCGTCTYLCPTCHCFEIKDTEENEIVSRRRLWDSCMYPRFTLHAGGHNPRAAKPERFRQRVLHKYVYLPQNYGFTACTGCGRCIRYCPGGLNIKNAVADIQKRTGEVQDA